MRFKNIFVLLALSLLALSASAQVEVKRSHYGKSLRTPMPDNMLYGERLGYRGMVSGRFNADGVPDYLVRATTNFNLSVLGPWEPLWVYSGVSGNRVDGYGFQNSLINPQDSNIVTIRRPGLSSDMVSGLYYEFSVPSIVYHMIGFQTSPMSLAYDIVLPSESRSLVAVDDQNNDGVEDLLLEAEGAWFGTTNDGEFRLYSGATGALLGSCAYELPEGYYSAVNAGTKVRDLTGDGVADVMFLDSEGILLVADVGAVRANSGSCLAGIGLVDLGENQYLDVIKTGDSGNGPGANVVIGGSLSFSSGIIREYNVQLIGDVLTAIQLREISSPHLRTDQNTIDFVPDITGDGRRELLFSFNNGGGFNEESHVALVDSSTWGVLRTYQGAAGIDGSFGDSLVTIGDLNGDGISGSVTSSV